MNWCFSHLIIPYHSPLVTAEKCPWWPWGRWWRPATSLDPACLIQALVSSAKKRMEEEIFRRYSKNITEYLYQKKISKQNANHVLLDCMLSSNAHKIVFSLLDLLSMACLLPPIFFAQRYSAESREIHIGKPLCSNRVDIAAGRKKQNSSKKIMKHEENDEENTAAPRKRKRKWKSLRQNRNSNQIISDLCWSKSHQTSIKLDSTTPVESSK